jgi:hypothetical protein
MDAFVINIIEVKQHRKAASCSTKGQLTAADEVCVCGTLAREERPSLYSSASDLPRAVARTLFLP